MESNNNKMVKSIVVLLVLALAGTSFAVGYQPIPADANQILASGIADATGTGGTAFVEYWVWDGANGYYYYTYQIHNPAEDPCFTPYIKHLEIGNPTGEEYLVTGSSGGGPPGGTPWSPSVWQSGGAEGTLVTWTASDTGTVLYPGQTSWDEPLFQFVSQLPPSIAHFKVRQGTPDVEADGLIPTPSTPITTIKPRSAGYWKHQFIGEGAKKETIFNLMNYMNEIEGLSNVFNDDLSGNGTEDLAAGSAILDASDNSDMRAKAEKQLFALWLNIASNKLSHFGDLTFANPNGQIVTASATEVATEVETILNNTSATAEQLEYAKNLAQILNLL